MRQYVARFPINHPYFLAAVSQILLNFAIDLCRSVRVGDNFDGDQRGALSCSPFQYALRQVPGPRCQISRLPPVGEGGGTSFQRIYCAVALQVAAGSTPSSNSVLPGSSGRRSRSSNVNSSTEVGITVTILLPKSRYQISARGIPLTSASARERMCARPISTSSRSAKCVSTRRVSP